MCFYDEGCDWMAEDHRERSKPMIAAKDVELQVIAKIGRPARVGNIGTVVARAPNARGEQILEFTFSRALMNKITRRSLMGRQRLVDKNKKLPDTDRQQPE